MDKKFQAGKTFLLVVLHPAHLHEGWDGDRVVSHENFALEEC